MKERRRNTNPFYSPRGHLLSCQFGKQQCHSPGRFCEGGWEEKHVLQLMYIYVHPSQQHILQEFIS